MHESEFRQPVTNGQRSPVTVGQLSGSNGTAGVQPDITKGDAVGCAELAAGINNYNSHTLTGSRSQPD